MGKSKKEKGSGASGRGGSSAANDEEQNRHKLQAVLLADTFNTRFRPLSFELPRSMSLLVNVPMIDYTLEFLATNGVEELFVFCVSHAKHIENYLKNSRWGEHMIIKCITSSNCRSVGDALREVDQSGVIRSDPFVLLTGDVVANMDLRSAIARHKEKRKADSTRIMTVCLQKVGYSSRTRPILDNMVVGISPETQQICYFYDDIESSQIELPLELFEEHPEVEFRNDLLDTQVYICAHEVLLQMSDNFDYQDIRKEFITYEVANVELGNKICAEILSPHEYAVHVDDLRIYDAVSKDIIRRWTYPLVPDNSSTGGMQTHYTHSRGCIYKHPAVVLPRSVSLGKGVVIGEGAVVGEGAKIDRSVIGRGCAIGTGAVIVDSYIWEDATVEDGAVVEGAILARRAVVMTNAHVPRGGVLGEGCVLGAGKRLNEFTRVTCSAAHSGDSDWGSGGSEDGDDDDGEMTSRRSLSNSNSLDVKPLIITPSHALESDAAVLGPGGVGRVWDPSEEEDAAVDDGYAFDSAATTMTSSSGGGGGGKMDARAVAVKRMISGANRIRCQSIGCVEQEKWKSELWTKDIEDQLYVEETERSGDMTEFGQEMDAVLMRETSTQNFEDVIKDVLITGRSEGHPLDNLLLEIKGYKFAQNKNFEDCISPVAEFILDIALCGRSCSRTARLGLRHGGGDDIAPALSPTPLPSSSSSSSASSPTSTAASSQTPLQSMTSLKTTLTEWKKLLKPIVVDVGDEMYLLLAFESYALQQHGGWEGGGATLCKVFRFALQLLYDLELVGEGVVLEWARQRREETVPEDPNSPAAALFNDPQVQEFIDWLADSEEEDDSDDDDDDDDDDDEGGDDESSNEDED